MLNFLELAELDRNQENKVTIDALVTFPDKVTSLCGFLCLPEFICKVVSAVLLAQPQAFNEELEQRHCGLNPVLESLSSLNLDFRLLLKFSHSYHDLIILSRKVCLSKLVVSARWL